jgi:hypothetical protein
MPNVPRVSDWHYPCFKSFHNPTLNAINILSYLCLSFFHTGPNQKPARMTLAVQALGVQSATHLKLSQTALLLIHSSDSQSTHHAQKFFCLLETCSSYPVIAFMASMCHYFWEFVNAITDSDGSIMMSLYMD